MRVAQELLGVLTIGGGVPPARGWWWRESKESKKPSKLSGMYENDVKTRGFPHLLT
jgi:hypothetical protein